VGRFHIVKRIAGTAVKQSMMSAGGSGEKFSLFQKGHSEAPQRKVMGNRTADAAADDNNMSIITWALEVFGQIYNLVLTAKLSLTC